MRFEAIQIVHPTVDNLRGENDARDKHNNPVALNEELIAIEVVRMTDEENEAKAKTDAKKAQNETLDTLKVEVNSVSFDANSMSIGYMSSALGLGLFKAMDAQYKISKFLIDKDSPDFLGEEHPMYGYCSLAVQTYEEVFKTTIPWKNSNNEISNPQIETVCEALEKAMYKVSEIKTGK